MTTLEENADNKAKFSKLLAEKKMAKQAKNVVSLTKEVCDSHDLPYNLPIQHWNVLVSDLTKFNFKFLF